MPGRGTRRVRGPGDTCAWCKHMGAGPNVCTWKSFGNQNKFVSGADVAAACFGHMVASVWDGSNVRRQNSDNEILDKKKQNESNISWSPSFVRIIHNRTYGWLKECLMYNPQSPNCRKSIRAVPILAHFRDMSAALKRRGLEHLQLYAWVDNKSTLRHLRILLERGCESCTRNTPQDNMRGCDHFNIDFSTCCL